MRCPNHYTILPCAVKSKNTCGCININLAGYTGDGKQPAISFNPQLNLVTSADMYKHETPYCIQQTRDTSSEVRAATMNELSRDYNNNAAGSHRLTRYNE